MYMNIKNWQNGNPKDFQNFKTLIKCCEAVIKIF